MERELNYDFILIDYIYTMHNELLLIFVNIYKMCVFQIRTRIHEFMLKSTCSSDVAVVVNLQHSQRDCDLVPVSRMLTTRGLPFFIC